MRPLFALLSALLLALALGCGPTVKPPVVVDPHDHGDDHGHDHHGHDHGAGPNGGKLLEVGANHVEWVSDNKAGKVLFVILDESMKEEIPIAMTELTIDVELPGKEKKSYKVPAINTAEGKASKFEVADEALVVALGVGTGVTLHLDIDGKQHAVKVADEHKEGDHGHDH